MAATRASVNAPRSSAVGRNLSGRIWVDPGGPGGPDCCADTKVDPATAITADRATKLIQLLVDMGAPPGDHFPDHNLMAAFRPSAT
jgi:hypothetical protein